MGRLMRRFGRRVLAAVFPERCAACGQVILPETGFCPACAAKLERIPAPACPFCGREAAACRCRQGSGKAFERLAAPFYYDGTARRAILDFKERSDRVSAATLAAEMAASLRRQIAAAGEPDDELEPALLLDFIVAVPVHPADRRRKTERCNPAERLARALSRELGIPFRPLLAKTTRTPPQKGLGALGRSGNVLGVFDVTGTFPRGARFLLVDDVSTTGATLNECAKMLKLARSGAVWALTAAVTPPQKDDGETET